MGYTYKRMDAWATNQVLADLQAAKDSVEAYVEDETIRSCLSIKLEECMLWIQKVGYTDGQDKDDT